MWDSEVALRVRERKISEIAKVLGYTNQERRYRLLGALGRDLEICNCAVSGSGICAIPSAPVSDPGYRSALSGADLEDEEALDSIRVTAPQIRDFIRDILTESFGCSSEDDMGRYRDAIESLKEELSSCRERVEELSAQVDYKNSEIAVLEEERRELAGCAEKSRAQILSLRSELSDKVDEVAECRSRMAELSDEIEALKSERDSRGSTEGPPLVTRIKEMKLSKIDHFMGEMLSGRLGIDLCDEVVGMLKVDVSMLRSMEESKDPLGSLTEVAAIPSPEAMATYNGSLTQEERALEESFAELIRDAMEGERK